MKHRRNDVIKRHSEHEIYKPAAGIHTIVQ